MPGFLRFLSMLVVVLLIAGCGGGSRSSDNGLTGEYRLVQADTRALPTAIFDETIPGESPFHLKVITDAGTLTLRADGKYEHIVQSRAFIDGGTQQKQRYTDRGIYRVLPERITFESTLYEDRAYTAQIRDGALHIHHDILGEGKTNTFTFRR